MEAQPKCNLIIDSCCDLPFEVIDTSRRCELLRVSRTSMSDGRASATICTSTTHARTTSIEAMRDGEAAVDGAGRL